jgi:hypothetical protein
MRKPSFIIAVILVATGCVDPYDPPVNNNDPQYLVVDGFINADDGVATVKLSRTLPLSAENVPKAESSAVVKVEAEGNEEYLLAENNAGVYVSDTFPVSTTKKYRLKIQAAGKEYLSDYITPAATPEIDTITWSITEDGLDIYGSTRNNSGTGRYYKWDFTETYEYNSPFISVVKVVDSVVQMRDASDYIYKCYRTEVNKHILVTTTSLLSENVVSNFKLLSIPNNSIKLSVRYSMLVKLQSLSEDAYTYWVNVQKNTETLGGLFDPLPSQVKGNLHCTGDPAEPVIGFFDGGDMSEKRIFISKTELKGGHIYYPPPTCEADTVPPDQVKYVSDPNSLITPVYATNGFPALIGYTRGSAACIDCRIFGGGTLDKPDFWK